MLMTNPIIPWIGGKRRLAELLLSRFPAHTCYVEVFAGGAAVYFARNPAEVEVLNDVNGDLVNLYRVVTHHLEEFVRQFKWALTSRQVFKWLQETRPETLTDVQRAARFFYLQQQSFGGKVAGQSFGTATTAPAINLLRIEENLSAAHLRLAGGTYVENLDWASCIDRYDRAHTLFYLARLTGRQKAMACHSPGPNTKRWPRSCVASRARPWSASTTTPTFGLASKTSRWRPSRSITPWAVATRPWSAAS